MDSAKLNDPAPTLKSFFSVFASSKSKGVAANESICSWAITTSSEATPEYCSWMDDTALSLITMSTLMSKHR